MMRLMKPMKPKAPYKTSTTIGTRDAKMPVFGLYA
jgi:hypothetical protein